MNAPPRKAPTDRQRPSTARRVTRSTERAQEEQDKRGLCIHIDGADHTVVFSDVTPQVARQVRSVTGMGFMQIVAGIAASPDVDLIAAFLWVEKLLAGEKVTLQSIDVDYDAVFADDFDISDPEDDEVTGPEA